MKQILLFTVLLLTGCVSMRSNVPEPTMVTTVTGEAVPLSVATVAPGPVHLIRIAIAVGQTSVELQVPSHASVSGLSFVNARTVSRHGVKYFGFDVNVHDLQGVATLKAGETGEITVGKTRYRGTIELIPGSDGHLTVVNQLPMDDYIMGVLAGEIPGSWPLEALKAQAVAARTFAVFKERESRKKGLDYDLENTTQSQMYLGAELINENIRKAVLQTSNDIMTYQDQPIMAVFHSNCGGRTTGSEPVWGSARPYLRSVSCDFDHNGKHYRWQAEVPIVDAARALRKANSNLFDITGISDIQRDNSGRVLSLSLRDGDGVRQKMKGAAFRMALGADVVRSTRFDVKLDGGKMILSGTGWGHGVGLCQDGACGMAKAGYGAFDILRHYYYGIIVEKMRAD